MRCLCVYAHENGSPAGRAPPAAGPPCLGLGQLQLARRGPERRALATRPALDARLLLRHAANPSNTRAHTHQTTDMPPTSRAPPNPSSRRERSLSRSSPTPRHPNTNQGPDHRRGPLLPLLVLRVLYALRTPPRIAAVRPINTRPRASSRACPRPRPAGSPSAPRGASSGRRTCRTRGRSSPA